MRCPCLAVASLALVVIVSSCTNSGISSTASYNPGYGPFDRNGNYVEAWADKPAKKHWWSRKPAAPKPAEPKKEPPRIASNTRPSTPASSSYTPITDAGRTTTVSRPPAPRPAPATTYTPPKPKPKPKPAPVKVKPKSITHTVKAGDTLYGLGRRYGTSVSAIQRANGISGSTIRIGQKLKIPR